MEDAQGAAYLVALSQAGPKAYLAAEADQTQPAQGRLQILVRPVEEAREVERPWGHSADPLLDHV